MSSHEYGTAKSISVNSKHSKEQHEPQPELRLCKENRNNPDQDDQMANLISSAMYHTDIQTDPTLPDGAHKTEADTLVTIQQGGRNQKVHLPPIRTLLALSFSFNLAYTAFNGIQNIQSSINQTAGLGLITMAVVYGMNPIAAPLGPTLLRIFGCKKMLLASWASMAIFVGANFYTSFYTFIPGAAIFGFVCAHIGTVSIMYTTAISDSYVAKHELAPERRHGVLSLFNGIFYTFWEATQVTGNLISSLVLSLTDKHDTEVSVCGAAMCPMSNSNMTSIARPAQEAVYTLFSIFMACVVLAFLVAAIFLPNIQIVPPTIRQTVCQGYASCYKMFLDKRCALLVPLFLAQPTMALFLYTGFTKAYISCTLGVSWVGFIMMVYGTSTAICATVINSFSRFLGRRMLIIAFIFIDSSVLLTLLLWDPVQHNSKIILFCIAAVAGISEGISQAQFNALISTVFKDNLVPAFVAYVMTKNVAASVSLGASNFACVYHRIYANLTLYALGFIGYIITEFSLPQKQKILTVS